MKPIVSHAIKVIRIRSLIAEALLSIEVSRNNPQLNDRIKNVAMRSCDVVEHIADYINGGFITGESLIRDLESAKHILELFSVELKFTCRTFPNKNEIDTLIKEIQTLNLAWAAIRIM